MDKIRVDKWLWTIRIFKSRTLSGTFCKGGKVKLNGHIAKASSLVTVGDTVDVKRGGFLFTFKANQILKSRVSASLAVLAYTDLTPVEELNKYKIWFLGKENKEYRERGTGRPTKKERREIEDYKDLEFVPYDWEEE